MDNIISESSDVMINKLNFGLPQTSQYITDRRQTNYFPSGSNVYAPNAGNKNIRFYISGEANQYLDLSSVRLFAYLQNTDGTRAHSEGSLGRSPKPSGQGIFKHYDSAYLKWLKDQLGRRETMDKLLSFRNDLIEANKRVNYRNQIHRINNEIQRDNLAHNSFEHLQHQINQFRNLSFT